MIIEFLSAAQAVTAPAAQAASSAAPAAAHAPGTGPSALIANFGLVGLMFGVFYFLVIRPQQKRMKDHQAMLGAVKRGDVVVTSGGIIGKVVRVDDKELQLDLGDNLRIRVVRSAVAEVRTRSEPVPANDVKAD